MRHTLKSKILTITVKSKNKNEKISLYNDLILSHFHNFLKPCNKRLSVEIKSLKQVSVRSADNINLSAGLFVVR